MKSAVCFQTKLAGKGEEHYTVHRLFFVEGLIIIDQLYKKFICPSHHGTDENQHVKEPEPLFFEVTLFTPPLKQEK